MRRNSRYFISIGHLREREDSDWIDIQVMTPHMETFGAVEIRREEFLKLLHETQEIGLKLF